MPNPPNPNAPNTTGVTNYSALQNEADSETTGQTAAGPEVSLVFNDVTTALTVGAAGTATTMPLPLGYVEVLVNGKLVKMAFFNP